MCDYTSRSTQPGRPLRLWQAKPPSLRHCVGLLILVHASIGEGEEEQGGVGGGGGITLYCVCACTSANFLRPDVFTVRRLLALCLGVVMGRFVPLPGTAFFLGRTSTPEEEVEEREDEEEGELIPSSEDEGLLLC